MANSQLRSDVKKTGLKRPRDLQAARNLAERLNTIIRSRGVSVAKVAELMGVSQSQLSSYRNAERDPSLPSLRRIASALQISLDWLILGDEHPRELAARTKIGALADELNAHLESVLIVEAAEGQLPLSDVRRVFPSPLETLEKIDALARQQVLEHMRERRVLAWTLLKAHLDAIPYGVDGVERATLERVAQEAGRTAFYAAREDLPPIGVSPFRSIIGQTNEGAWVAECAIYGAGAWIEGVGFAVVLPTELLSPERARADPDGLAVKVAPEPRGRSLRTAAESDAARRLTAALRAVEKLREASEEARSATASCELQQ